MSIRISGKVQGVWYRGSTQQKAQSLDLAGWVKNEGDGSVRIHAFGDEECLQQLLAWCYEGPKHAQVKDVGHESIPYEEHFGFTIQRI